MLKSQVFDSALDMLGEQGMDRLMQGACTEYAVGTNYHESKIASVSHWQACTASQAHSVAVRAISDMLQWQNAWATHCAYQYAHAYFDVQWLCPTTHTRLPIRDSQSLVLLNMVQSGEDALSPDRGL